MADDILLPHVRAALIKEGWQVKKKAFSVRDSGYQFFIDVEAERDGQWIAVEVKSWQNTFNADWYQALGQYLTYQDVLRRKAPDVELFLAVPVEVYDEHFKTPLIQNLITKHLVKLLIFNWDTNSVTAWQ
ncbi:MAG TPA: element excision factor XisH family protein [Cytophagales bacterium]